MASMTIAAFVNANSLSIPLADKSVHMWYNHSCLDEQNTRALCFILTAAESVIRYYGQSALYVRTSVLAVRLGNGGIHGGRFAMCEIWKEIPSHPGYYASSLGRIKCDIQGKYKGIRILKLQTTSATGYPRISLKNSRKVEVHSLVAEAFHGPRPEGMQCRHLNGDKLDNTPDNLRWGTVSENAQDSVLLGVNPGIRKLKEDQAEEIRKFFGRGLLTVSCASRIYGISQRSVRSILKRETYKLTTPPPLPLSGKALRTGARAHGLTKGKDDEIC